MNRNPQRGAVQVVVILAVVALGWALWPTFKLPAFLQKKPPVAQLSTAEDELAKAKAAQAQAEAALASARAAEAARTDKQLDYAQQFAAGTSLALARVPDSARTPEIILAGEMALRANAGLDAARGKLPPEMQVEMQRLVADALSAVIAERDAYAAELAKKDAELQITVSEKSAIESKIPALQASVQTAQAAAQVAQATVETKTKEVAAWAEKKAASDARAGSLDAYAGNLARILIGAGIVYFAIHWLLPSLAQSYPGSGILAKLAGAAKNVTTAHL